MQLSGSHFIPRASAVSWCCWVDLEGLSQHNSVVLLLNWPLFGCSVPAKPCGPAGSRCGSHCGGWWDILVFSVDFPVLKQGTFFSSQHILLPPWMWQWSKSNIHNSFHCFKEPNTITAESKNECENRGKGVKYITLMTLWQHNEETERRKMKSYLFLKFSKPILFSFMDVMNINKIDFKSCRMLKLYHVAPSFSIIHAYNGPLPIHRSLLRKIIN